MMMMANSNTSQMNQTAASFLGARRPTWMIASQSAPPRETNLSSNPSNQPVPSDNPSRQDSRMNDKALPQMVTSSTGHASIRTNDGNSQVQRREMNENTQRRPIPSHHTDRDESSPMESNRSCNPLTVGSKPGPSNPVFRGLWDFINMHLRQLPHSMFTEPTSVFQKRYNPTTVAAYARLYRQKLNAYESSSRISAQESNSMETSGRIELLHGACSDVVIDELYLMIHQILCQRIVSPAQVPECLRSVAHMENAFGFINSLLGFNSNLDMSFIRFAAQFPKPFTFDAASPVVLMLQQVLTRMVPAYNRLLYKCISSGIPPLVEEIVMYFGVNSPTLQRVLFISLARKSCYTKEDQDIFAAEKIFKENQEDYNRSDGRGIPKDRFDQYITSYYNLRHYIESRSASPSQQASQNLQVSQSIRTAASAQSSGNLAAGRSLVAMAPPPMLTQLSNENVGTRKNLFPPRGMYAPQTAIPDSSYYGAHQAHLRPPTLKLAYDVDPSMSEQRRYQYVNDFFLRPTEVPVNASSDYSFNLSKPASDSRPIDRVTSLPGAPQERILKDDSKMYRLRCIESQPENELSNWCSRITIWPSNVYFSINGARLQPRRKLIHGRDLPIDITSFLKEGANIIKTFCNRSRETSNVSYSFAIETVILVKHNDIVNCCHSNAISEADARASMIRMLAPPITTAGRAKSTNRTSMEASSKENDNSTVNTASINKPTSKDDDDDDDIFITSNTLTISLLDPQSQTPCAYPVRGASCRHRSNFDLLTFLNTRRSLSRSPAEPVDPDEWICPICRGDVRPPVLIHDGWMEAVLKKLASSGTSGVREVVVDQQGDWTPKIETCEARQAEGSTKPGSGTVVKVREVSEEGVGVNGTGNGMDLDPQPLVVTTTTTIAGADVGYRNGNGNGPSTDRAIEIIELE